MLSKPVHIFFGCLLTLFNPLVHAEPNLKLNRNKIDSPNFSSNVTSKKTESINLTDAISKTFKHNPALRGFRYALKAQNAKQLQASLAASPELNFVIEDALGSGDFKGTDKAQATLSIAWVLEGDVRRSYMDVAQSGTLSLTTEINIKRLDAASETARFYIRTLAFQARLNNAIKTVALASQSVSAVKKRVSAGKSPEAELARAKAELAKQQLEHENIEHELGSAIRILAAQWGETQPNFTQVDGDIFNLPITQSFKTLITKLKQSPGFTRLMSDKRIKQAQLKLAQSKSDSQWRLNLGVRHFETTNDQALVAGFSIPFGERSRNTGGIIEARENLSQTQAKTDEIKVQFETKLYVLSQELQHSLHRIKAYRSTIIPQLEKALNETRRAYNLGRYSYFEWRSVQADLLDARSTLVESSINAHLKVIEIERLTGVPIVQLTTLQSMSQPISK